MTVNMPAPRIAAKPVATASNNVSCGLSVAFFASVKKPTDELMEKQEINGLLTDSLASNYVDACLRIL
jgi:hypothetical protein